MKRKPRITISLNPAEMSDLMESEKYFSPLLRCKLHKAKNKLLKMAYEYSDKQIRKMSGK